MQITTPRGSVTLRAAQPSDVFAFRELRLEALRTEPAAFSADHAANAEKPITYWEERLNALGDEGMIYFAAHDERLIGMCGVHPGNSPKTKHSAWILGVYVQPEWRGLHLAEGLINQCAEWARSHGITILKLGVAANNIPAIRCYTRCGFQVFGVEPQALFSDGMMHDELMMARVV